MELKPPKPKKKSNIARLISWGRMFKTPLLILFLLGTTNCELDGDSDSDIDKSNFPSELSKSNTNIKSRGIDDELLKLNLELNVTQHNFLLPSNRSKRIRHGHRVQPEKNKLAQIRYLRRHMNKVMLNFVMSDVLIDGEVENRVHFNGVTAKETYVNADGNGLRLRQLTDGRHLVQVIYNQNGVLQDCEFITQGKTARNFLKTLRKELKQALDEETYKIMDKSNNIQEEFEKEKFYRHFGNVTLRILKNGETLPPDVATWFDYDRLKMECLKKHEEIKYVMENNNKASGVSLARYRRSFRENFILPGTKWCGAGQLAEDYSELGAERTEDRCCRAHDNCRRNIGQFRRRFGIFNFRPYTISHCRCDRRFRACLKLADTSVSNMVGKLFFNVVQTKCFILKPVKTCTQRSWWGKCLRRGYAKQAFLRDNLPY